MYSVIVWFTKQNNICFSIIIILKSHYIIIVYHIILCKMFDFGEDRKIYWRKLWAYLRIFYQWIIFDTVSCVRLTVFVIILLPIAIVVYFPFCLILEFRYLRARLSTIAFEVSRNSKTVRTRRWHLGVENKSSSRTVVYTDYRTRQ